MKNVLNSIFEAIGQWHTRPRVYKGLFSKSITVYANNQVVLLPLNGLTAKASEANISVSAEGAKVTLTLKDANEASAVIRAIYSATRPAWTRLAKGAFMAAVFALFVTVFAEQPQSVAADNQANQNFAVPTYSPPPAYLQAPSEPANEMGLPPAPFSE